MTCKKIINLYNSTFQFKNNYDFHQLNSLFVKKIFFKADSVKINFELESGKVGLCSN